MALDCLGSRPSTLPNSCYKDFTSSQGLQGPVGEIGAMGIPDDPEAAGAVGEQKGAPIVPSNAF